MGQAAWTAVSEAERSSFYRAGLIALRYLEHRRPTGRRFGAEADARWLTMRGHLATADRIDLLLADADREWLGAFGARTAFNLDGIADDEPFGHDWSPLDAVAAEELWRALLGAPAPADVRAATAAVARAWDLDLQASPSRLDASTISPADKLLVAGPSALAAAIAAFADAPGLDWADQVRVIATPPAHRHLAALGAALVNAPNGTTWDAKAGGRLLVSDDAHPADAALARECAR